MILGMRWNKGELDLTSLSWARRYRGCKSHLRIKFKDQLSHERFWPNQAKCTTAWEEVLKEIRGGWKSPQETFTLKMSLQWKYNLQELKVWQKQREIQICKIVCIWERMHLIHQKGCHLAPNPEKIQNSNHHCDKKLLQSLKCTL